VRCPHFVPLGSWTTGQQPIDRVLFFENLTSLLEAVNALIHEMSVARYLWPNFDHWKFAVSLPHLDAVSRIRKSHTAR